MAADYASLLDVKAHMPDGNWGTSYDVLLATLVTRASRAIDRFTRREPGAYQVEQDTTRVFDGSGETDLWIGELATAPTSVSMAGGGSRTVYTALAATDYLLWPANAASEGRPYLRLDLDAINGEYTHWYRYPQAVTVVGKFGYAEAPPEEIVEAVVIQAARWFKRGQQAFADTGAVESLGQLRYVKPVDPDVALLLEHLRRMVV